jgi:hypothetical protein
MTKVSAMSYCILQCSCPQHPLDKERKISGSWQVHCDIECEGTLSCFVPPHPRYMDWWEVMRLGNRCRWFAPREQSLPLDQYVEHWGPCEENDLVQVAGTATEKMSVVHSDADVDLQIVSRSDRNDVLHHVLGMLLTLVMGVLVMEEQQTKGFETCFEWVFRRCQSMVLPTPFY